MSDYGLTGIREPTSDEVERFARERGRTAAEVLALYGGKAPFVVCEIGELPPLPRTTRDPLIFESITDRDPGDETDALAEMRWISTYDDTPGDEALGIARSATFGETDAK